MNTTFDSLVEQMKSRSAEEKEELKFLLERALIEERRREIRTNYRQGREELKKGKLKFSSSVNDLKKSLAVS